MDYYQLKNELTLGMRLPNPTDCPEMIAQIISRCFHESPSKRSTFVEIKTDLHAAYVYLHDTYLKPPNSEVNGYGERSITYTILEHTENLKYQYMQMRYHNPRKLQKRAFEQSLVSITEEGPRKVNMPTEKASKNELLHYVEVPFVQNDDCAKEKSNEVSNSDSSLLRKASHKTCHTLKRSNSLFDEKPSSSGDSQVLKTAQSWNPTYMLMDPSLLNVEKDEIALKQNNEHTTMK